MLIPSCPFIAFIYIYTIHYFFYFSLLPVSFADSVGTKNINGKDYVIYMVNAGETVYGISSKYKVPINELNRVKSGIGKWLKNRSINYITHY
jgi:hypothetical protein